MFSRGLILLALVAVLVLPFLLRPRQPVVGRSDDMVVIITPNNEAIRYEYTEGFRRWYRARTGRTVTIDWRVIGGTSEINRFLASAYVAAFQNYWTNVLHRPWSAEVEGAFANGRPGAVTTAAGREARAAFLASDVGCGIDLFFGGGTYDFDGHAAAGRLVPSRVRQSHPEWFTDAVIPQSYAGEEFWDPQDRWFGNVLSNYGILCNKDALTRLGFTAPFAAWRDLADPRLVGEVALCDPTKSGSMATAFENLLQQQMQLRLQALRRAAGGALTPELEARGVREGWDAGMKMIRLIGANARYFTDSSQKPPIDVAQGNAAAGICIDFYGRYEAEAVQRRGDTSRLVFVTPRGGTVSSVDPIGVLRGAPHREVAEAFLEYTLSMPGQKLWNFKVGAPGGPERYALRRLPVRRDFYAHGDWRQDRSDPEANPFDREGQLIYVPAWTGGLFRELAFAIRVMCLDSHAELVEAWRAVIAAGRPPAAMAALNDMSILSYDAVSGPIKRALDSRNPVDEVRLANELGAKLRAQYRHAADLARAGK